MSGPEHTPKSIAPFAVVSDRQELSYISFVEFMRLCMRPLLEAGDGQWVIRQANFAAANQEQYTGFEIDGSRMPINLSRIELRYYLNRLQDIFLMAGSIGVFASEAEENIPLHKRLYLRTDNGTAQLTFQQGAAAQVQNLNELPNNSNVASSITIKFHKDAAEQLVPASSAQQIIADISAEFRKDDWMLLKPGNHAHVQLEQIIDYGWQIISSYFPDSLTLRNNTEGGEKIGYHIPVKPPVPFKALIALSDETRFFTCNLDEKGPALQITVNRPLLMQMEIATLHFTLEKLCRVINQPHSAAVKADDTQVATNIIPGNFKSI